MGPLSENLALLGIASGKHHRAKGPDYSEIDHLRKGAKA